MKLTTAKQLQQRPKLTMKLIKLPANNSLLMLLLKSKQKLQPMQNVRLKKPRLLDTKPLLKKILLLIWPVKKFSVCKQMLTKKASIWLKKLASKPQLQLSKNQREQDSGLNMILLTSNKPRQRRERKSS